MSIITVARVRKLLREPRRYSKVIPRALMQPLCWLFKDSSFYLQGQMNIHPKSRWYTYSREFVSRTGGFFPPAEQASRRICSLEPHDNVRRDMLALLLRTIIVWQIPGAFAELGVYRGHTARLIHQYCPERVLYLFDTFCGFTERGRLGEREMTGSRIDAKEFSDTSVDAVRQLIDSRNDNVVICPGFFPDSVTAAVNAEQFAFVHLDADLYEPTLKGLEYFYPRMSKRGVIVVHDYNAWIGARTAVDDFFRGRNELPLPMPDKSGSVVIVKQ